MENLSIFFIEIVLLLGIVAVVIFISYLKFKRLGKGKAGPKALLDAEVRLSLPAVCRELEQRVFLQDQEIESLRFSLRTAEQTYLFWRHIAEKRAELLAELKAQND